MGAGWAIPPGPAGLRWRLRRSARGRRGALVEPRHALAVADLAPFPAAPGADEEEHSPLVGGGRGRVDVGDHLGAVGARGGARRGAVAIGGSVGLHGYLLRVNGGRAP